MNVVDHLVEKLPESPSWPYHDTFAEYDHELVQEHMPLGPSHHSSFYVAGEPHGYDDYREYANGVFRHAKCFADSDCSDNYTCEVTDSFNHISQCLPISDSNIANVGDWHERIHGDEPEEKKKHTERGHFEIGYWCLKNTDCESKHCAQVGPRMYDKECQGPDYVDAKKLEKKKRTHHKRDPEPEP